ncbi:hypothetical protein D9613_010969 [Agrocybe pediades]|uniref:Hyaluronan/mRNA-binding protein domain-containing protein n=1 Tax=Agrocybe pediades TaxID=84607 RepID=A0A8H4VKS9_9AGAR|nr:hypothetical protein D9613_010969 [Agrocybe pediades]
MTRTSRATYPRALVKDAHESRSGLDNGLRKQGAGHHNWGSLADERDLETQALDDENVEEEEDTTTGAAASASANAERSRSLSPSQGKPELPRSTSGMTEEEIEKARQLRKNAFKKSGDIDLGSIARSSVAVSTSPSQSQMHKPTTSDEMNPIF